MIPARHSSGLPTCGFDSSFAFWREGYTFISRRCEHLGVDAFRTRMFFDPVVCMRGREAAEIFYGPGNRFTRQHAMPASVLRLLQDEGSVQSLDGEAHRWRKALFTAILGADAVDHARRMFAGALRAAYSRWRGQEVVLHAAIREVLVRFSLSWAGVPVSDVDIRLRAAELCAMVDKAGSVGPANWWARYLRNRAEAWAKGVIAAYREGDLPGAEGGALAAIATYADPRGVALDPGVAAVELLNVIRPTVAIGNFIVFAVLALARYPRWREAFADGGEDDILPFVQEVRRFYPFFPIIAGRVRDAFDWRAHAFRRDDWVMLDLYGTNHDPDLWPEPQAFFPERFRDWSGDSFALIPQGGGEAATSHRCPGEDLTIALTGEAVRFFSRDAAYRVPVQDMSVSLGRMPAMPKSGLILRFA